MRVSKVLCYFDICFCELLCFTSNYHHVEIVSVIIRINFCTIMIFIVVKYNIAQLGMLQDTIILGVIWKC